MESAVYLSATQKIYGVRGQWIYECDPVSGSVLRSARFCDNTLFGSTIISIGTKLYVGVSYTDRWDINTSMPGCDIFVIDPTTLPFGIPSSQFGWDLTKLGGQSWPYSVKPGWGEFSTDGTILFGWSAYEGLFQVDPTNVPGTYHRTLELDGDGTCVDTTPRAGFTAPFVWITNGRTNDIFIHNGDFTDSSSDTGGVGTSLGGITLCNSTMKVYAVKGTEDFYKVDANEPFSGGPPNLGNFNVSVLHTAPISGVINPQPARIRACNVIGNPYFGKVLIPTMKGDSVIVWDSASDLPANAVCKTGFSAPYDVVFTPTGAMAVQNSSIGLKPV